MNSWALETKCRHIYSHMTKPNRKDPTTSSKESLLHISPQSMTHPTKTNLKRIHVKTSAVCPLFNHPDKNIEHHLFDFLPANTNIRKCLYDSHSTE